MKTYLQPSVQVLLVDAEDLITTSGGPVSLGGVYENDNDKGIGYGDLF